MKILGLMTCFNRKEKTVNSIKKLMDGNFDIDFHFIVVDDKSNDGTAEALKCFGDNVTILTGTGGLYYSGGMRMAIDYAKNKKCLEYDYVLLFNDDVDFFDSCINSTISFGYKGEIIVGATINSKGKMSYGGVKRRSTFSPAFDIVMSDKNRVYCDTFNANCVLIPGDVFIQLDNIDPIYGHSLGDYDYGLSASKQGFKIVVTDFYVGKCENNPVSDNWLDKRKSRKERLKLKESVKGLPCKIWFHFLYKNYGIVSAIVFSISQYVKIIIKK